MRARDAGEQPRGRGRHRPRGGRRAEPREQPPEQPRERSAQPRERPRAQSGEEPLRRARGRRRGRRGRSDLLARVAVAVPAAVVAVVLDNLGGIYWALFMLAIGCVCVHELHGLLARWRPAKLVSFASVAALVAAAWLGSERTVLEVALAALPVAFLAVAARGRPAIGSVSIAGTLLGVWWIGVPFALAVLLRRTDHGAGVLIDLMVGTFVGDTGAYIGGRLFGRRPLAPSISPRKTVEGLFCGVLFAILSVYVVGLNQAWLTHGDALLVGIATAVLGPIGDLFESMVKRDAGAKDAGSAFGAHGGALDRLDAVIFTVVAGYYIWSTVGH